MRDILSMYGRDTPQPQAGGVSCGGVLPGETKDVMNYKPPQGPTNIMDPKSPGLHGVNSGTGDNASRAQSPSGTPKTPGTNICPGGSQGRY